MNYDRSPWRKLYIHEPNEHRMWSVTTRGIRALVLTVANDDGVILESTDDPARAVCHLIGVLPEEIDVSMDSVRTLLGHGYLTLTSPDTGESLWRDGKALGVGVLRIKNFAEAQRVRNAASEAKARWRAKKREEKARLATDATGRIPTEATPGVPGDVYPPVRDVSMDTSTARSRSRSRKIPPIDPPPRHEPDTSTPTGSPTSRADEPSREPVPHGNDSLDSPDGRGHAALPRCRPSQLTSPPAPLGDSPRPAGSASHLPPGNSGSGRPPDDVPPSSAPPDEREQASQLRLQRPRDPMAYMGASQEPEVLWAFEEWVKVFSQPSSKLTARRGSALMERYRETLEEGRDWRADVTQALRAGKASDFVSRTCRGEMLRIFEQREQWEAFREGPVKTKPRATSPQPGGSMADFSYYTYDAEGNRYSTKFGEEAS